jgi:hypothetical protein
MIQDDEMNIPQDYLCPISQEIMTDPVMAADGQTYDRKSIEKWLSKKTGRSPLNGSSLSNTTLIDNLFARKIIREYQSRLPDYMEGKTKLEKSVQQKEEIIQTLIEKIDKINKNQISAIKAMLKLKKKNLGLKKLNNKLEDKNIKLEEKIVHLQEINYNLLIKQNGNLSHKPSEINNQPRESRELPNKKYLTIDVKNFKKCISFKFDEELNEIFELSDGQISCWFREGVKLLKLNNNSLELSRSFFMKTEFFSRNPIKHENGNFIFRNCWNNLKICDKDFKEIQTLKESFRVGKLWYISEDSFAFLTPITLGCIRRIKIYSKNSNTGKYESKVLDYVQYGISSLLYLPKQNYLLSGSIKTIDVLCLSKNKLIKTLTVHIDEIYSLILLNDETFASSSDQEFKIWSIKEDTSFECINTIKFHKKNAKCDDFQLLGNHEERECLYLGDQSKIDESENQGFIYLQPLGNDFFISYSEYEFKIWDKKNYECLKTYREDSGIALLIVTKNNNIVTSTYDKKVNVWQIKI